MSAYQDWVEGDEAPWQTTNDNNDSLGQAWTFAERKAGHSGLNVGLGGGAYSEAITISDQAVACTDDDDTYIVANRSTGAVTASTGTTNWNDTGAYGRIAIVAFAAGVLTSYRDFRFGAGGIFRTDASGAGDVVGPASSVDGNFSLFDGTSGKLLKDGGIALDTDGTLAANSNTRLATQAAVKAYVDATASGLSWKRSVRAASTANGTLATAFENGDTLDGVTLATGDRILLKNQSSASENGIYVVAVSGAPARASDADSSAELVNASVYVSEGTTNADTAWVCTTNAPITVGSTSLAWAQFNGGGGITALTGDVTASGPGSVAATIAARAVTAAKLFAATVTSRLLLRKSASGGDWEEGTLSELLDFIGSAAQGDILYRGSSAWARLGAGTAGQFLQTQGAAANPQWAAVSAGKQALFIPAAAMRPSVTGGCAAIAAVATSANRPDLLTLDFDASTEEYAQFALGMPKRWNEGTVTFKVLWSHAATTTNFGTVWGLQAVAVSDDDTIDAAYGTAQTVTDTGGTTSDLYTSSESSAITIAGTPVAEDMVFFRVYRKAADGSDTLAIDARLHGVIVYFTTDAETDA